MLLFITRTEAPISPFSVSEHLSSLQLNSSPVSSHPVSPSLLFSLLSQRTPHFPSSGNQTTHRRSTAHANPASITSITGSLDHHALSTLQFTLMDPKLSAPLVVSSSRASEFNNDNDSDGSCQPRPATKYLATSEAPNPTWPLPSLSSKSHSLP